MNSDLYVKIENIDEKQVPELIQSQFKHMTELQKEIVNATNNAYDAKENAINEVGAKMNKKTAIENLQGATIYLANAQIDAMKAQKKSFEYQLKLAETTKFLFRLGLTNIAMNRVVVTELEYKLKNASEEELDELAIAEIKDLLQRLKEQQDIEHRHNELVKIVAEQRNMILEMQEEIMQLKSKIYE